MIAKKKPIYCSCRESNERHILGSTFCLRVKAEPQPQKAKGIYRIGKEKLSAYELFGNRDYRQHFNGIWSCPTDMEERV